MIPDTFKILCALRLRKRADDLAGLAACDHIVGPASSTFSRGAPGNPEPLSEFKDRIFPWDY